jgi:hypothetical protein
VLAINGDKVGTTRDLERLTRSNSGAWQITINRAGQVMTTVIGG